MSNVPEIPAISLALVIDDKVVEVLHTDERLAAIFLSSPTIVDVSNVSNNGGSIIGWVYDGITFINPSQPIEE